MLTEEQFGKIIDRKSYGPKQKDVVDALNGAMTEALINTPLRIAAFLSQVLHETGGLKWFAELGDDAYFAKYNGRKDLGNTEPGDGPRFKGRGFIQITGRANYTKAGRDLNLDLVIHPELAETLASGARIAGWYWKIRNINKKADAGDIVGVTKLVNGGTNGLDDRTMWYTKAKKVLGA